MRSAFGMNSPQSLKTSGVHARRCPSVPRHSSDRADTAPAAVQKASAIATAAVSLLAWSLVMQIVLREVRPQRAESLSFGWPKVRFSKTDMPRLQELERSSYLRT
jgi:hypothetical protein